MRIVAAFRTSGDEGMVIKLDTYLEEGQQASFEIGSPEGLSTVTLSAIPEEEPE